MKSTNSAFMSVLYHPVTVACQRMNDMNMAFLMRSQSKDVVREICYNIINKLNICRFYINILKVKQSLFMQILYESSYYLALLLLRVQ